MWYVIEVLYKPQNDLGLNGFRAFVERLDSNVNLKKHFADKRVTCVVGCRTEKEAIETMNKWNEKYKFHGIDA